MNKILKVGITHGNINGISYETIFKLFSEPEFLELCTPVIFGSLSVANYELKLLKLNATPFNVINDASEAIEGRVNFVNCLKEGITVHFGEENDATLNTEIESLKLAIEAVKDEKIDGIVSTPGALTHRNALISGASKFIQKQFNENGEVIDVLMDETTMVAHYPITTGATDEERQANKTQLINMLRSLNKSLRMSFDEIRPEIALVCSDKSTFHPMVKELQEEGILVFGPFTMQEVIESNLYKHYNITVDTLAGETSQLSTLIYEDGCAYSAGLPIIHTFPIMNEGLDIAGKCEADESGLRSAIYALIDIYHHQRRYKAATRKPLEKQWIPRGKDDFKLDLTKEE